jgi:membrane protease YdiL (CAAX protease family)
MDAAPERSIGRRLAAALRVETAGCGPISLLEMRRIGIVPAWVQLAMVVGLFVATVFLCHAEYREKGTTFGYGGPAFNVLVNPIYEEIIFRGLILGALVRSRSAATSIAVSSALFGIFHLRNVFWLDTGTLVSIVLFSGAVIGPVLAWLTLRCRSVWPAVILHYLNNLFYFVRH